MRMYSAPVPSHSTAGLGEPLVRSVSSNIQPQSALSQQLVWSACPIVRSLYKRVSRCPNMPIMSCSGTQGRRNWFFNGQPYKLYDYLTNARTFMRFTAPQAAGAHCLVVALRVRANL